MARKATRSQEPSDACRAFECRQRQTGDEDREGYAEETRYDGVCMITFTLTIEQIGPEMVKVSCKCVGVAATPLESLTADAVSELLQEVTPEQSTGNKLTIKSNPEN